MKKDSEGVKKRGREISRKRRPLDPLNADRARGGPWERGEEKDGAVAPESDKCQFRLSSFASYAA